MPYLPAGQGEHEDVPVRGAKVPIEHTAQTAKVDAPETVEKVPAGHPKQEELPLALAYIPAPHEVQVELAKAPVTVENFPVAQAETTLAPAVPRGSQK